MPKKLLAIFSIFINYFLLFVIISNNICNCDIPNESNFTGSITKENHNTGIPGTDLNKNVTQSLEKEKKQMNSTLEKSENLQKFGNQTIGKHLISNKIKTIIYSY